MKVEIPDEMLKSLIELAKEYTTQDNRATAMPYHFQIRTTKEVVCVDGRGEQFWFDDEGYKVLDIEEYANEYFGINISDLDDFEDKLLEEGFQKLWVEDVFQYEGVFLTAKACKEHITRNKHHYREPVDYLNHAWRNPEMDLISNLLIHLSKEAKQ